MLCQIVAHWRSSSCPHTGRMDAAATAFILHTTRAKGTCMQKCITAILRTLVRTRARETMPQTIWPRVLAALKVRSWWQHPRALVCRMPQACTMHAQRMPVCMHCFMHRTCSTAAEWRTWWDREGSAPLGGPVRSHKLSSINQLHPHLLACVKHSSIAWTNSAPGGAGRGLRP